MSFNPDTSKRAEVFIFSSNIQKINYPSIYFNNNLIKQVSSQKFLGKILETKLNFLEELKNITSKANKTVGLLRKLLNSLPGASFLTIFKLFVRPHFHYGTVIYDQSLNNAFHQRTESVQYNAVLALTNAIRGSSR